MPLTPPITIESYWTSKMATAKKETKRARANRKILEVCRALRVPENQITKLERDPDLVEHIRYAIFIYAGMRADGLLVCEGGQKVKVKPYPKDYAKQF
jgi:hypothetical protein